MHKDFLKTNFVLFFFKIICKSQIFRDFALQKSPQLFQQIADISGDVHKHNPPITRRVSNDTFANLVSIANKIGNSLNRYTLVQNTQFAQ